VACKKNDGRERGRDLRIYVGLLGRVVYLKVAGNARQKIIGIAGCDLGGRGGQQLSILQAMWRQIAFLILSLIPLVNLFTVIMPLWDARRRTLHDIISKTYVLGTV
jgi:uncharacterized RDD family membrane protein YckC